MDHPAHRVGEPYGSLVLAVAVTVIEVALIETLMFGGGGDASTLARDTVFAAVIITCTGIVGVSLLAGTLRQHTVPFNAEGAGAALATVTTLATLGLVLLALTTVVSVLTVVPGRATLRQAGVHISLLAAYLFLSVLP